MFLFLFAVALGTILGGPIGDRYGRKLVIWVSILGVAPFTLALPHANLFWTGVLTVVIGIILASAFSAILVYAQELVPGKVGLIAGLFFGLAFGMAGIGSAVLGELADRTSIEYVFQLCSFLPLIGLLTAFLPNVAAGIPKYSGGRVGREEATTSEAVALRLPRATRRPLHSALRRRPDELVHLELETNGQLVGQNPFDDLARIDPAENRREENRATALRQSMLTHLRARPFVIFARADDEFHFVARRQVLDVGK